MNMLFTDIHMFQCVLTDVNVFSHVLTCHSPILTCLKVSLCVLSGQSCFNEILTFIQAINMFLGMY
jgi:hypothetical protein